MEVASEDVVDADLAEALSKFRLRSMTEEEEPAYIGQYRLRLRIQDFAPRHITACIQAGQSYLETGLALCESPIERKMLPWLIFGDFKPISHRPIPVMSPDNGPILLDEPVLIVPQLRFGRYRLDFAIRVNYGYRIFVAALECDGKDFHNPDDDRERDAYLRALGVPTIRATGSEINCGSIYAAERAISHLKQWAGCP